MSGLWTEATTSRRQGRPREGRSEGSRKRKGAFLTDRNRIEGLVSGRGSTT